MYNDVNHGSVYQTQQMEKRGDSADVIRLLQRLFGGRDYVKVHAILPHIKTPAGKVGEIWSIFINFSDWLVYKSGKCAIFIYRLITAYLLLQVNCDKIMHAR